MATPARKPVKKNISPAIAVVAIVVVLALVILISTLRHRRAQMQLQQTPELKKLHSSMQETLLKLKEQGRGPLAGQQRGPGGRMRQMRAGQPGK